MQDDIFIAAQNGDIQILRKLLYDKPNLIDAHNSEGWTALHLAAHFGNLETAKELLSQGAEVNSISKNELANNPLHAAVAGNHTHMVAFLIESGANINARQHGGWTPLHSAAQHGNLGMVKLLVENGADVNPLNDQGASPAMIAAGRNHQHIVEYLQNKGARQTQDVK